MSRLVIAWNYKIPLNLLSDASDEAKDPVDDHGYDDDDEAEDDDEIWSCDAIGGSTKTFKWTLQ